MQSCAALGAAPEGPCQALGKGDPGQHNSNWILDTCQGKRDAVPKRTHSLVIRPLSRKGQREKESHLLSDLVLGPLMNSLHLLHSLASSLTYKQRHVTEAV